MTHKKLYKAAQITIVKLDNEISLILNSDPPFGPDEAHVKPQSTDNVFRT
jgi:hypothetical protein